MATFQPVEGKADPKIPKGASENKINCHRTTAAFLVAAVAVAGPQGAPSPAQSRQGFAGSTGPTAPLSLQALMHEPVPVGRAGTAVVLVLVVAASEDTVCMRQVAGTAAGMVAGTIAGAAAGMTAGRAAAVEFVGAGRTAAGPVRS